MVAGGLLPTLDGEDDFEPGGSAAAAAAAAALKASDKRRISLAGHAAAHLSAPPGRAPSIIYLMSVLSAMGGFLFGYDTGIVSGAMVFVRKFFNLNSLWQEVVVSITILGAWILSLMAGSLCERYGRKTIILWASTIFTLGSLVMGVAWSKYILLFGRLTVGVAIGLASTVVPMYIAEVAPSDIRGSLVTLNNCFITFGQLSAAITAGAFSYDVVNGWRWMLALAAIPAVIQFGGFMFMPESPRWLIRRRRDDEALAALQRIRGHKNHQSVLAEFEKIRHNLLELNVQEERRKAQKRNIIVAILRKTATRRALIVGCLLQAIQQLAGINTVMYYTATIIEMSGVQSQSIAVWLAVPTAAVYVIFSFCGYLLADRLGRRTLTLGSLLGVIVSLLVLGTGFQLSSLNGPRVTAHNMTTLEACYTKSDCLSCLSDSRCGFCYDAQSFALALCLERDPEDGTKSLGGECSARRLGQHHQQAVASAQVPNNYPPAPEHLPPQLTPAGQAAQRGPPPPADGHPSAPAHQQQQFVFAHHICPSMTHGIGLNTWLVLTGLVMYLAAFAPGMGPMPWTINSEIYPMWARSFCYSIATSVNWMFNLLISLTFISLTEVLTTHGAFYMYSVIAALGWLLLFWKLPETRGRSLEDISQLFAKSPKQQSDAPGALDDTYNLDDDNSMGCGGGGGGGGGGGAGATVATTMSRRADQTSVDTAGADFEAQLSSSNGKSGATGVMFSHLGGGRRASDASGATIMGHDNLAFNSDLPLANPAAAAAPAPDHHATPAPSYARHHQHPAPVHLPAKGAPATAAGQPGDHHLSGLQLQAAHQLPGAERDFIIGQTTPPTLEPRQQKQKRKYSEDRSQTRP